MIDDTKWADLFVILGTNDKTFTFLNGDNKGGIKDEAQNQNKDKIQVIP